MTILSLSRDRSSDGDDIAFFAGHRQELMKRVDAGTESGDRGNDPDAIRMALCRRWGA